MGWKVCYPKHTNTHGPTDTHTHRDAQTHTHSYTHTDTHTHKRTKLKTMPQWRGALWSDSHVRNLTSLWSHIYLWQACRVEIDYHENVDRAVQFLVWPLALSEATRPTQRLKFTSQNVMAVFDIDYKLMTFPATPCKPRVGLMSRKLLLLASHTSLRSQ